MQDKLKKWFHKWIEREPSTLLTVIYKNINNRISKVEIECVKYSSGLYL